MIARITLCSIFLCGLLSGAWGQEKPAQTLTSHEVPKSIAGQIRSNEEAVWEAARNGDMKRFNTLVADDSLMIFTSGVMTKQQYIEGSKDRHISSYTIEEFQTRMPNEDTVITLYVSKISGVFGGRDVHDFRAREASVWVKRNGHWVAVLNQETPLP